MNNTLTKKEREHVGRVKELDCSVCDASGPSQAHHVKQHQQYTVVALCPDCHNSWHGLKHIWRVKKMDEIDALAVTVKRLVSH